VLRSFDGLAVRQLRTRRLRAVLTAFGIVLGVGMVFGVLLLVGTIRHTFDDLIDSAWGKADLVVMGEGGTGVLPRSALETIRSTDGVRDAGAMVGSVFVRVRRDGRPIRGAAGQMWVAGFDPKDPPYDFRYVAGRPVRAGNEVIVERNWARDRAVGLGQAIAVATPTGRAALRVVGVFRFSSGLSFGAAGLAGMPIASARALMDVPSGYMQISLAAADRTQIEPLRRRLQARLGPGVSVKTPKGVGDAYADQLKALNVVLYFFSGIALFVGAFLILNSFNMTVLQRMRELGMLRTLGATRAMIARTVLAEALALGAIGTMLGLGLGLGLALGLIAMMQGFGIPIGGLHVTAGAALTAAALGPVVTVIGVLRPARRAGRVPPIRAVLGIGAPERRLSPWRALAGVALFVPGLVFGAKFWFGGDNTGSALSALTGIGMTMGMFLGMTLLAPWLISPLVRALSVPLARLFPTGGRLAADAARANSARTAATAAALTIGLSVVVVNGALAGSMLGTISDQIDAAYARDLTIQPQGQPLEIGGGQAVPAALRARIAALPQAAVVTPVRSVFVRLPGVAGASAQGLAIGYDPAAFGRVDASPVAGATRASALRSVAAGGLIVNRAYARAARLAVGDRVRLRGAAGVHVAPVAGVLDSLGTFNGPSVQMSLATLRGVYGTIGDAQLVVKARSPGDRRTLERAIAAVVDRDYPNLEVLSTGEIKRQIEDNVDRQFAMFNAIIVIAVIVSLLGVVNTLAMSVMERTREIGVLRAMGSSRWQVRLTMVDESLLITLSGAIAGVGLGALIGWAWVLGLHGIMPGVGFRFPWQTALVVAVAAVALGVLAAILPARRAARLDVIDALGYE
jgi:putative ABC transport system permease protein